MMWLIQIVVFCILLADRCAAGPATNSVVTAASTNRCPEIELKDQFDQRHSVKFPLTKLTIMTVADKQGSDGIKSWAHPLAVRFGERIAIAGLADVSTVPKVLRSYVQGKFRKAIAYPVMLDWEGDVCRRFNYTKGTPNIYLIARDGCILTHLSGPADEAALQQLSDMIEAELQRTR